LIAVDTNILVFAHRADSPFHPAASKAIAGLAEGAAPWAIPWPCIHEFLTVVTRPRVYVPPSTPAQAVRQVDLWMDSPTLLVIGEADNHWDLLRGLALRGKLQGPVYQDARIAAICVAHGVQVLWTADRDFSRFPTLQTTNPLLG
jgi:uncharacterized protein